MQSQSLNQKVVRATKWSAITEIMSKLVTPITSMVLARLLTPEAFGVVTTISMIITFAEIFTDAGFQKYIVQHEFKNEVDKEQSTNVAFWSNFIMSMLIWGVIAAFCEPLATLVGNPGLGVVVFVACAAIPLAAFSSIQMALYRRRLDFKTFFRVRIFAICIPLFVTIPCALIFRNYLALIFGMLAREVANAFLLTWYSSWKPRLYYSFTKLKEMFSFTVWSMIEAVSIWLTKYVDVFIVGTLLSQHYLGLYKTSSTLVGHILGIITTTVTPILFSSLSRVQNDRAEFKKMFFKFQKVVALFVFPIGVIIFSFCDLITNILLGDQWMDVAFYIGLWGLVRAMLIVYSHFSSEAYRAMGRPKLSVLAQWLFIIVLWPTVLISIQYGFESLCVARALITYELLLVNMVIMHFVVHISPIDMIRSTFPSLVAGCVMMFFARLFLLVGKNELWQIVSIALSGLLYFFVICFFKDERSMLLDRLHSVRIPKIINYKN